MLFNKTAAIMSLLLLVLCLVTPVFAIDAMDEVESLGEDFLEGMEIVAEPIVSDDPIRTFLNLYSFLQRDLGEGGIVVMDDTTMELVTAVMTSSTGERFFASGVPDNTMYGYIPSVPPAAAMLILGMTPNSREAVEQMKTLVVENRKVFMFIAMRLEHVPEETVIKPLDVHLVENTVRSAFDHRGLDADKAFDVLCDELGLETADDLIVYIITDPMQLDGLIDRAAQLMYPRSERDNSTLVTLALVLFASGGILAALAIVVAVVPLVEEKKRRKAEKEDIPEEDCEYEEEGEEEK